VRAASRRFVVPSSYTQRSLLIRFESLAEADVVVLYSPATEVTEKPVEGRDLLPQLASHVRRFFLVVSGDRWVKNSYRVFAAIESLYSSLPEGLRWPVVVTGAMPPLFPRRWASQLMFVGRCSTAQLAGLYANAGCLLYPSLNEGFGYPPIEAMSYGTPVLAGAMTAVPEIAAEGATYFCPFSIDDIRIRIGAFLTDPELRQAMSVAASRRYRVVKERQRSDLQGLCDLLLA
jgi:glycosyltransferase involved in cell wall biosynthesis